MREAKMFIDGAWVDALDGGTFQDLNPYTGAAFATIAGGTASDAKRAVDAAEAAFPEWSATPPSARRAILLKAADLLEARMGDVAATLTEEAGATVPWAGFQVFLTTNILREAATHVHRVTGEVIPADLPGQFSMALRQPVGVVVGIGPWNAPLILCTRSVAYAIAYGNTAVLKPSAEAPLSGGVVIAEIFEEAGLPKGVLNLVVNGPGRAGEIGDTLVADPRVRRLSFTGSSEVGRRLAEQAGGALKRVTLELGGSDAMIVLADADIDNAVNAAVFGRYLHQGQVCMSTKRFILERPVAEEFTSRFVARVAALKAGDPADPATAVGPIINATQRDILHRQVQGAVAQGAKIACGGTYEGNVYQPTVLTGIRRDMACFEEELFGPVASLIEADDADDAIALCNQSPYGLSSGVMTRDLQKALDIAERLDTGMVHINDASLHDEPQAPFGGVKDSGYGRHGGLHCIEEFTEVKWVTYQKTPRQYPL